MTVPRRWLSRWPSVLLMAPTVFVLAVWATSGMGAGSQPLPSTASTHAWRVELNYLQLQINGAAVPQTSLPTSALPRDSYHGYFVSGVHRSPKFGGGIYFFGWVVDSRGYILFDRRTTVPTRLVSISLVGLLLVTFPLLWPAWRLWRRPNRTDQRHRVGLCVACGYDLRASPGRCPECGIANDTERRHELREELRLMNPSEEKKAHSSRVRTEAVRLEYFAAAATRRKPRRTVRRLRLIFTLGLISLGLEGVIIGCANFTMPIPGSSDGHTPYKEANNMKAPLGFFGCVGGLPILTLGLTMLGGYFPLVAESLPTRPTDA